MNEMKKQIHNKDQLDLFGLEEFTVKKVEKKEIEKPKISFIPTEKHILDDTEMMIRFAKKFKHSIAFLDCVLRGLLPGNYHGSKLWLQKTSENGGSMEAECEDYDYFINQGLYVIESKEVICVMNLTFTR